MNIDDAKATIDKVIKKGRIHWYKPIQVAEILYRDRVTKDIDLAKLETYRTPSRHWRDKVSSVFLGNVSSSSARFQDDLFNVNATPPDALVALGIENRSKDGAVEHYIYSRFKNNFSQLSNALSYATKAKKETFELKDFINGFWAEPGLKRSIDKIYEISVYSLFSVLIEQLDVSIQVGVNEDNLELLAEFNEFAKRVLNVSTDEPSFTTTAKVYRVGVTNAADRGLDMWANYGPAIQIKHLTLDIELAKDIVESVAADKIIIVCRDAELDTILALLRQIGWRERVQSVITESDLIEWYEKGMRGDHNTILGAAILQRLAEEISYEFPAANDQILDEFFEERNYSEADMEGWTLETNPPSEKQEKLSL